MKNVILSQDVGHAVLNIDFVNQPLFIQIAILVIILSFITIITTLSILYNRRTITGNKQDREEVNTEKVQPKNKVLDKDKKPEKYHVSAN